MSLKPIFLKQELSEDIDRIFDASVKVIDKDGVLKEKEVEKSINLLALARNAKREVDAAYKVAVKPIKDQLSPFDFERKAKTEKLDRVDEHIGLALLERLKEKRELPTETAAGTKLAVVGRKRPVMTDITKIPPEYFCVDWASISAAIAEGKEVPGVELREDFSLRTTLPETIA